MAAMLNTNFIIMAVNRPGWVALDRFAGNLSLKKKHRKLSATVYLSRSSVRFLSKLLTAEIVRQTNARSTARVLECSDRFYPFIPWNVYSVQLYDEKSVKYRKRKVEKV